MKRIYGIGGLLLFIILFTGIGSEHFFTPYNIENLLRRTALFGVIGLGASVVIIAGGIDLSIGSVVCLTGCLFPWFVVHLGYPPVLSVFFVLVIAAIIGLLHGVLITKLKIQPFIVTLCGLLLYRGAARGITADQTQGFGNLLEGFRSMATGRILLPGFSSVSIPTPLIFLFLIALLLGITFRLTALGQHLFAIGYNEQAARFSGIATKRIQTLSYTLCSVLAGVGGILFVLDVNSAQPADFGNFYELYAIAAAVLGGCSLRGGEGSVLGVIIGTAVIQVLRNSITLLDIPTQLEFAIIGAVILAGAIVDQMFQMNWRRRKNVSIIQSSP